MSVKLMAKLLYGSGLRLIDCIRFRVKDIDSKRNQIVVRDGKGIKGRKMPMADLEEKSSSCRIQSLIPQGEN